MSPHQPTKHHKGWIGEVLQSNDNGVNMDYLRMDGKQYASNVRNKALEDFDWLSQWLERSSLRKPVRFRTLLSQTKILRLAYASLSLFRIVSIICMCLLRFTK